MKTSTSLDSKIGMLSSAELEQQLLDAIAPYPFENTRFYRLLVNHRLPQLLMARYARHLYAGACEFNALLSNLIKQAPNPKSRLVLLENLLEEEGISLSSRGLTVNEQARHPTMILRFTRACGVTVSVTRQSTNPFSSPVWRLLEEHRWLEGVAFLLVGQELNFSTASEQLYQGLLQYGFAKEDLKFFAIHGGADAKHGREALDLVIQNAHSADAQRSAILAAASGAKHWFDLHNGTVPQAAVVEA